MHPVKGFFSYFQQQAAANEACCQGNQIAW